MRPHYCHFADSCIIDRFHWVAVLMAQILNIGKSRAYNVNIAADTRNVGISIFWSGNGSTSLELSCQDNGVSGQATVLT